MRTPIDLSQLKQIQIEILDVVHAFCKKHEIRYWLDSGTLIGAVRHKGYIPWDDDIDLGMLRDDYNRFCELFNRENDRYRFHCQENDRGWCFACGKILDTSTVLCEPDEDGVWTCVNIDLFVYDNAPDDDVLVDKMYKRRDQLMWLHDVRLYSSVKRQKNLMKKIFLYLVNLLPQGWVERKISENSRRFAEVPTRRVGNFTAVVRIAASKDIFDSFVEIEFEGKRYLAPVGYHEWLTSLYGNYMQLPPEEKRVSHHLFVAWKEDC